MWLNKFFKKKPKNFTLDLDFDIRKWDYCPIGYGMNIDHNSMIPCPRCKKQTPAIQNSGWIGNQQVCLSCYADYKNLCKVVDSLPKLDKIQHSFTQK